MMQLVEVDRFAVENRRTQGQGQAEAFDLLRFTHCYGTSHQARFQVFRRTVKKRMLAAGAPPQ